MWKKQLLRSLARGLLSLLPFLLLMIRALPVRRESGSMENYFLSVFGGPASSGGDFVSLMLKLVPPVLVLYLFSGVMLEDCAISYVYVFPRWGRKEPWLRQKTLWLLVQIVLTFLLAFAVCFAVGAGAGFHMGWNVSLYARLLLFQCGVLFTLSFAQNFFSLGHGRTQSFLFVLVFYVVCVVAVSPLSEIGPATSFIASLLPPVSQIYACHADCPLPAGVKDAYAVPIAGFTTARTAVVLGVFFLICYGMALHDLRKKDLVELMKGESS
jgi:uncharacterized membrane protein SirB2